MSLPTPCLKPKTKDQSELRKDVPIKAHNQSVEETLAEHGVPSVEEGLTNKQVEAARAIHGRNELTPPVIMPEWLRFLLQFWNMFAVLLIAGGILCWVAYALDPSDPSNMYLGIVLIAVVVITSIFGYVQEAAAAKTMDGFKSLVPRKCKVVRSGNTQVLDASDLVPGDIVHFQEGDQVPADLRVIAATSLKVDNSSLTGESEAQDRLVDLQTNEHEGGRGVPAIEAQNLMFFSTIVTNGFGTGIVVGTGDNTVMGQIAGLAGGTEAKETLIAKDIHRFIGIISVIAITLGVTFLIVGITTGTHSVVEGLVFAIGVIVATVPEGLLVTLTVSLALTAKRMHAKNVLVKNTESVETLGSTTLIASDKTGTLTQNRMTVQHCWVDGQLYTIPAFKNAVEMREKWGHGGTPEMPHFNPDSMSFQALQKVATLCNNSDFIVNDPDNPDKPALVMAEEVENRDFNLLDMNCTGDASESGLIKGVQLLKDVKAYRAMYPKLFEIKFNSTNKWQLSIHKNAEDPSDTVPLMVLKGAPERVIQICSHIMIDGQVVPMTKELEQSFLKGYEAMGSLGERVLGHAMKRMEGYGLDYAFTDDPEPNFPRDNLTFVGLFSLMDPPRDGVKEAVTKCKTASVKVFMVTGDHPITAEAIAKQIGIIDQEVMDAGRAMVVTGDDLRDIIECEDPAKQKDMWDRVLLDHDQLVFARVTPAHKLQIVEANQQRGQIVSVTGDGVNDAPALKMANVGVAMGIAGKDVTKEAADIILMDDNFASIVNGVEEGRLIFDNLKKSIMYTLTSKIPELMPFIIFVAGRFPLAISTILILCVDLGTDMVPAISLAYETREADIMKRPPRDANNDHLVDWRLLNFSYMHFGIMQAVAGYFAFIIALNDFGYRPGILQNTGIEWTYYPLICTTDGPTTGVCGYGCESPVDSVYAQRNGNGTAYCKFGCNVPTGDAYDPFSEFTPSGFRGFAGGMAAACGRSCSWYQGLTPEERVQLAGMDNLLTPEDVRLFDFYCAGNSTDYGFPGRPAVDAGMMAPANGMYWWAARPQAYPNMDYQNVMLRYAQTAYFIAVVLGKMMTVIVSKTRLLSVFQHGIMNNNFLLFAIVFEVCLMVLLVYVPPFNSVFGTEALWGPHWLLGVPWMVFLFAYDETRKWLMRRSPEGYVRRSTYW